MKRLALLVATVAGAGYAPVAPGTVGSAVGIALYLATRTLSWQAQGALILSVTCIGLWAAGVAAEHFGREDPGQVVVDEVAGQLVTLFATGVGLRGALLGFFVFRVFDVLKPWPANRFERLPGGLGIMADDLMVGLYGNLVVVVAVRLSRALF
jgi:phosphatidylglycerophosphatase A